MEKKIFLFFAILLTWGPITTAGGALPDRFINKALYENIYPSTLNDNVQNKNNSASATKKTSAMANSVSITPMGNHRVVKRTTNARSGSNITSNTSTGRNVVPRVNNSRAAATPATPATNTRAANVRQNDANRRVIARTPTNVNRTRSGVVIRSQTTTNNQSKASSQQCFADYKECMDSYCERSDTAYNRCYCSARLAQIDSKYENRIDELIQQIIKLKYSNTATDAEIKSYWDTTVGNYTGDNPWVNIDNALNINWADTQSRVRGQNAFNTGHRYCVNHLRACSYMSSNLRDAYKSEIERDCSTYERGLERIQLAAESVIESYDK